MNGAESLVRTARAAGIELCLANPGTTELPLLAALDHEPGIRAVLGLFEGVCTGAADGYARMSRRPALTLLHLGPGFANGIANLHNARRARSAVVNLIGDHATWHLPHDAPLTSDIVSLANPVSAWVRSNRSAATLANDFADAVAAASRLPGQVATLIVPSDCQWDPAEGPARPVTPVEPARPDTARIEAVARRLRGSRHPALLLGLGALREPGLHAAARISAATGAALLCEVFPAYVDRGSNRPRVEKLPYFPEQAQARLADCDTLVLVGAGSPVSFFGYPGIASRIAPDGSESLLATPDEDAAAALADLADALDAAAKAPVLAPTPLPAAASGPLTPASLGAVLARLQPEGAIVVDEGATSGLAYFESAAGAAPHSYLALTGGAIGQGLPCATGAALACPGRKVIALQADGSGLYTLQALWTQAREQLDVVTLICANRSYRILQIELARAGIAEPGPKARTLTDLSHPELDWTALARGFGVPATRVHTSEQLSQALASALAGAGPFLIEVML